jgi:hypothetical protein
MDAKELRDPYTSPARRRENKERTVQIRKIRKYGLIGGLCLVAVVTLLYFTVLSRSTKLDPATLSPGQSDAQTLALIEQNIATGNANHADPSVTASAKERWQKDLVVLEKQRDELLKKNPGLRK